MNMSIAAVVLQLVSEVTCNFFNSIIITIIIIFTPFLNLFCSDCAHQRRWRLVLDKELQHLQIEHYSNLLR